MSSHSYTASNIIKDSDMSEEKNQRISNRVEIVETILLAMGVLLALMYMR